MERLPFPSWVPLLLGLVAAVAVFTVQGTPALVAADARPKRAKRHLDVAR